MDEDNKIIKFPKPICDGQTESDDYAVHRKQLIDQLKNHCKDSAVKKTGEGRKGKSSDSQLFREKKSALQVLSRRHLLSLLDCYFDGKSPVEANLKNAIINWFFAQLCFAGLLLMAAPNMSNPHALAEMSIYFAGVLFCLYCMISNRKLLLVIKTMRDITNFNY
jgi:hypothetical protein